MQSCSPIVYRLVPRGGSLDTSFRLIVLCGVNLPFVMMALVAGGTLNCVCVGGGGGGNNKPVITVN